MKPVISVKNLSVGYDTKAILSNLSFDIKPGELICLMGGNGCGKTTLLKTLSGIQDKISGSIQIDSRDINDFNEIDLAQKVAIVLTDRLEVEHLSVLDIVKLGRFANSSFWGSLSKQDLQIVEDSITLLNIGSLRDKMFDELSDGQKQKVLICRALAQDTPILFLDEPTTFLDIPHKMEVIKILKKIAQEKGIAVFFSSHDWELVLEMCHQVWPISIDGKLNLGSPEDFLLTREIENTFFHKEFKVNFEKGNFKELKVFSFYVEISGDDEERVFWTNHFLEKSGFQNKKSSDQRIIVNSDHWVINKKKVTSLFNLLKELA